LRVVSFTMREPDGTASTPDAEARFCHAPCVA